MSSFQTGVYFIDFQLFNKNLLRCTVIKTDYVYAFLNLGLSNTLQIKDSEPLIIGIYVIYWSIVLYSNRTSCHIATISRSNRNYSNSVSNSNDQTLIYDTNIFVIALAK